MKPLHKKIHDFYLIHYLDHEGNLHQCNLTIHVFKERKQKFQSLMVQINMILQYLSSFHTNYKFVRMYKFEKDGMVLLWMLTLT